MPLDEVFGKYEHAAMNIAQLRKERGLSLEAFARAVGLTSKGYASDLEQGKVSCSVSVALEIERLSEGRIPASTLSNDVALVEAARGQ